jgi:hypothetical protein
MPADPGGAAGSTGTGGLRLVPLPALTAHQLDQLRHAYEQAFPAELRAPLAGLDAGTPRDRLLVALDGDEVAGFAAHRLLPEAGWVFLRYFGVARARRRRGLGRRIWRELQRAVVAGDWPARIAFEVEDPAEVPAGSAERQVRSGRIAFWQSCGAAILPVGGYVMPALTELGNPEPMILRAADPGREGPAAGADLAALVRAIYTEHYRLAGHDPLLVAAVASIGATGD